VSSPRFKPGDEVRDLKSGYRGRIDRVDGNKLVRSYDVWFPDFAFGGVRMESQMELVSVIDRLAEVGDAD
jgi:hypothetical protein